VGSEGFSRFPSPHSLVSVGSDGFVFKSIVPTVTGELGFPKRELLRPFGHTCHVRTGTSRCGGCR